MSAVSTPGESILTTALSSQVTGFPHPNLLSLPLLAAMSVVNATPEKDTLSLKKEKKKIHIPKEL